MTVIVKPVLYEHKRVLTGVTAQLESSTWQVGEEGSETKDQPPVYGKFKACLGYLRHQTLSQEGDGKGNRSEEENNSDSEEMEADRGGGETREKERARGGKREGGEGRGRERQQSLQFC